MRLIDADELITAFPCGESIRTESVRATINNMPTIDIDRPQGEWFIEKTCYDNYNYRCSYCDWYETHAYPDVEPYNYCPSCGARMKGADDETRNETV